MSQEVTEQIAAQFAEAVQAEVTTALLGYGVAPVNFGRLRILDAAQGRMADLLRLVEIGNRYGQDWHMGYRRFGRLETERTHGEG